MNNKISNESLWRIINALVTALDANHKDNRTLTHQQIIYVMKLILGEMELE